MTGITDHLISFKTDCKLLYENTDGKGEIQDKRIQSVALRVMGTLLCIAAVAVLISSLTITAPTLIIGVIGTIFLAVIGHDLYIVGKNLSDELVMLNNPVPGTGVLERISNRLSRIGSAVVAVGTEAYTGTPNSLKGTWVLASLNRLIKA